MNYSFFPSGVPLCKRLFDFCLALLALLVASPVFLILCLLLFLFQGRPIFFKQPRPGYKGKIFTIYKFRTMTLSRDNEGHLLSDAQRLSPLGRFLRAASLDELPELINVLTGEMSLVGPRPLLVAYLERYSPEQKRRHDVLPGLTGWAQINGRNALSWQDKFRLDVWYVDHWSFWLDIKIIFLTVWKVIKREGISQPGQATTEEFKGNPD